MGIAIENQKQNKNTMFLIIIFIAICEHTIHDGQSIDDALRLLFQYYNTLFANIL